MATITLTLSDVIDEETGAARVKGEIIREDAEGENAVEATPALLMGIALDALWMNGALAPLLMEHGRLAGTLASIEGQVRERDAQDEAEVNPEQG